MADDALQGALDMMSECLEEYANSTGIGFDGLDAADGADEFGRYAADEILREMGVV